MPNSHLSRFTRYSLISLTLACSHAALAQVPVVEAGISRAQGNQAQAQPQVQSQTQAPASGGSNGIMLQMYEQMEQMKREISDLRGMVEQQSYQIRQMQNEQRDRYLDLDRRVSELTNAGLTAGATPGLQPGEFPARLPAESPQGTIQPVTPPASTGQAVAGGSPGAGIGATAGATRPATQGGGFTAGNLPANQAAGNQTAGAQQPIQANTTPGSEQDVYRDALNLLLEDGRYAEAIAGFDNYIQAYPSGRYLANAYYWQGEAMILEERYAQAERVFRKVVDEYPADPKAADALLKLGVVYNQTGNRTRAREVWESVRVRYPNSLAAVRAADDYLSRF